MNVVMILSLFITILLPISIHGLQCYSCSMCSVPFNTNNATITVNNASGASCYKTVLASYATKGATTSCVAANTNGLGTWCCNTDLCNAGQTVASMDKKKIMAIFVLAIGIMKMF
ncbi:hypothetical protein I4U23_009336 [Adineta vaga]|nr:hypothetical protein I4U23_009336 [Adineta vaga]